jgi:hypothetical protein
MVFFILWISFGKRISQMKIQFILNKCFNFLEIGINHLFIYFYFFTSNFEIHLNKINWIW